MQLATQQDEPATKKEQEKKSKTENTNVAAAP